MKIFMTAYGILALAFAAAPHRAASQGVAARSASCPAGTNVVWRSGVSIECNCALLTDDAGNRRWEFYAEPRVTRVAPDGYLAGVLRPGDAIVAVDGHLVTTAEGGRRYGQLEAGRPAELTFLRNGRLETRSLTPAPRCEAADTEPHSRSRRAPATPNGDARMTEGYLGLGVSASASVRHFAGEPPAWHFREPPVVSGLDPAGPAARAGLVVGDTLTHVNGVLLTSEEGGRLFGAIQPGDTVVFSYRGAGRRGVWRVRAGDRPVAGAAPSLDSAAALTRHAARLLEAYQRTPSFSGALNDVQVEVTGPATIDRLGDRIIVRSHDGTIVVTVRARSP